ncbi:MAG TPA: hypothetical protein VIH99_07585 [Bdellovibrionota bacterium]
MSVNCFKCGKAIAENNLGRQDSCDCGAATRCCRNCKHYDRSCNNECREEQAGRQVDKEKGNFCEWFQAREGGVGTGGPMKTDLKSAADALFKKK